MAGPTILPGGWTVPSHHPAHPSTPTPLPARRGLPGLYENSEPRLDPGEAGLLFGWDDDGGTLPTEAWWGGGMPQSRSLIRVREPRGAPCCGGGDGASDALWEQGSGNSAHWEGTEAHRIGALQEARLLGGGLRVPPYRSMRPGVNVHLEALDGRLQMRRLLREEVAASCGDDVMSTQSGAHLFCFHVRMPPARKSAALRDEGVADPLDEAGLLLDVLQPGDELDVCVTPLGLRSGAMGDILPAFPMNGSMEGPDKNMELVYTLRVESFEPAHSRSHGVLWCTA